MVAQRKYPDELRERAVKMVLEVREREGKGHGELARIARQLDVHPEALRSWMQQAEIDGGQRPGTTSGDEQRITELERRARSMGSFAVHRADIETFARDLEARGRARATVTR
jgi:transposase